MQPGIEIKRLRKTYWSRSENGWQSQTALDLQDVQIPFGKTTAILGRSGSGKSTLLSILGLVMPPDLDQETGSHPDNADITFHLPFELNNKHTLTLEELWLDPAIREVLLRKHFGFIFQDSLLFPGLSVKQNIKLPTLLNGQSSKHFDDLWLQSLKSGLFAELHAAGEKLEDEFVGKAPRDAGLLQWLKSSLRHHHGEATPDRYSGGQLQRFALVRSVLHNPSIIFADEPTGNLDPSTADKVFSFLGAWQRQSEQRTLIVVTHDVLLARRYADRILIIDEKHRIKKSAVYNSRQNGSSKQTRWQATRDQMTGRLTEAASTQSSTMDAKEEPVAFGPPPERQATANGYGVSPKVRFAWDFSRWDIWPKTPGLKWTTIVGLLITSLLSLTAILILGFYRGSSRYLEIIQSNPFIHSLNVSRPLTDAAIDQFTLSQISRVSASSEDPAGFYLSDTGQEGGQVLSFVSGFNRRSLWASLKEPEIGGLEPTRLRGRTVDPKDPVLDIVRANLISGAGFKSQRDIGLIISKAALAKMGGDAAAGQNPPKVLYSQYGSGIDSRIRRFPILGVAERLPEPGGDFLMTNFFYAQLVNHYFAPTSVASFEFGTVADMVSAEKLLREIRTPTRALGLRGSSYKADGGYNLKFTYRDGREEHEDIVVEHASELLAKMNADQSSALTLLPFFRRERSVSLEDTTMFSYGSLYLDEFKYAKGLQSFLQAQFKVDMNLGMVESLDTIGSMKNIITGIVLGMLACLGFTGVFVVYSVFSQFASRSSKQFGVLKTMGIDWRNLGLVHLFEVLIIFAVSLAVGLVGSAFLGKFLDNQLQEFLTTGGDYHQFFELSPWHIFILAIMMLGTYVLAAGLAVKNVYAKNAIELMKDQRNFSPRKGPADATAPVRQNSS